jgi:exosortase
MSDTTGILTHSHTANTRWKSAALCAAVLVATIWAYWSTLVGLNYEWQTDENYSVGQLVPLAALYLLWCDRRRLAECSPKVCWWGLAVIAVAQVARAGGLLLIFESAERYAFILTIWGVVLLVGGVDVFRRTFWILMFLVLMAPLPGKIHNLISGPLQDFATLGAVFSLELAGVHVDRTGNVIVLNDSVPLAVAEACSGLRMLTAFVVVSFTLAYIVRRPTWQKATLVLSSVPIAILCNIIRLVATAVLFMMVSSSIGETFFHDFAGLTMMPLAILILMGELWIMSKLVDSEDGARRSR